MQRFKFYSPKSLSDALAFLAEPERQCVPVAGGTDLVISLKKEEVRPDYVLDLNRISELKGISQDNDQVRIGAATTFTEMTGSEILAANFPLLKSAASLVGGPQIRNRGTIGGNIITNGPCADVLPGVLALGGELELHSQTGGVRKVPVGEALLAPYQTCIKPDEILVSVVLPKPKPGTKSGFEKVGRRNALAKARMNLSVVLLCGDDGLVSELSIVPGAVMPVACRMKGAESVLIGHEPDEDTIQKAAKTLGDDFVRVAGIRWSTEYKLPVLQNIFRRTMLRLLSADTPAAN